MAEQPPSSRSPRPGAESPELPPPFPQDIFIEETADLPTLDELRRRDGSRAMTAREFDEHFGHLPHDDEG